MTGPRGSRGSQDVGRKPRAPKKGGGGGPHDDDDAAPPRIPSQFTAFQAQQRAEVYKPYLPELELGAYISDWVIDAIITSLGRILDPDTAVLYREGGNSWHICVAVLGLLPRINVL